MEKFSDLGEFRFQPNIHELVRESYQNVIVEDVDRYHSQTTCAMGRRPGFGLHFGIPRFDYCLVLNDCSVRSILPSPEPENKSGLLGYVNVVDCDFDPNDQGNDCVEHYDGSLRICVRIQRLESNNEENGEWSILGTCFIPTDIVHSSRRRTSSFVHLITDFSLVPATQRRREKTPSRSFSIVSFRGRLGSP